MRVIILGSDSQIGMTIKKKFINKDNIFFFNKITYDITNESKGFSIFNELKPNLVINCAAYTNVIDAENNFAICNKINNISLKNLSTLSNTFNSTILHFSTDYVFNGKKKYKYIESDKTCPLSVYGKTKLLGENQLIKNCNNFLILRVSWLFSNYKNNFFKFVINKLINDENIYAVNDLYSIPTSADVIANFINHLIKNIEISKLQKYKEVFHFVNSGKIISWFDLACFIKKNFLKFQDTKTKIIPISSRDFFKNEIRPYFSALNNYKIRSEFNYKFENWQFSINSLINANFKL